MTKVRVDLYRSMQISDGGYVRRWKEAPDAAGNPVNGYTFHSEHEFAQWWEANQSRFFRVRGQDCEFIYERGVGPLALVGIVRGL